MGDEEKAELLAEWWRDWWTADYSWDGLASKPWQGWAMSRGRPIPRAEASAGARDATLQDYWRDQKTKLITAPDGSRFTVFHLPPAWRDGSPSPKAIWSDRQWADVQAEAAVRLEAGQATRIHLNLLHGPDRRAQFSGVCLRTLSKQTTPVHLLAHRAAFLANLDLTQQEFGPGIRFSRSLFIGPVDFSEGVFEHGAQFRENIISEGGEFRRIQFKGMVTFNLSKFLGPVNFNRTEFRGVALFPDVRFEGNVSFSSTAFIEDVRFASCTFSNAASFLKADFSRSASFIRATFSTSLNFRAARFDGYGLFRLVTWPVEHEPSRGAFLDAKFAQLADFRGVTFSLFSMFDGATFKGEVRFSPAIFERDKAFGEALSKSGAKSGLIALENAFRALKLGAENTRDRLSEQQFHRYELISRRKQRRTPPWEKAASYAFWLTADYGVSVGRPLGGLLAAWLAFAPIYWAWSGGFGGLPTGRLTLDPSLPIHESVWQALGMSLHVMVAPFAVWGPRFAASDGWEHAVLNSGVADADFAIRLFASFQGLLGLTLAFLVGLALKRRFQIS